MFSTLARRGISHFPRSMSSTSTAVPLILQPKQVDPENVTFLDSSWFMPNSQRNAYQEFQAKRLPGSRTGFLDLDAVAAQSDLGLKHMMPTKRIFADACEKLGITPETHVVLYDTNGVFSSPRALFMFRAFGHEKSTVLDGGLPHWEAEGFPVETSPKPEVAVSEYPHPSLDNSVIRSYEQMVMNSEINGELVLDARSKERFLGTAPEPREGLSSGHIPHSVSLPFGAFLQSHGAYTTFLPPTEIRKALEEAVGSETAERIIAGKQSVIASCGSGMTAAVIWLGLRLLGAEKVRIYDESWTGYAMRSSSKIEKTLS